jgi:hypothetical protein
MPHLRRTYKLSFEVLTPLHISLGPEGVLIPDQECDVDGAATYVIDRSALIAEFQEHPPEPAPPPKRKTYLDVLRNPDDPMHHMAMQMYHAGFVRPQDPVEDDDDVHVRPTAPVIDWYTFAMSKPRNLKGADKRWRTQSGEHLVRYMLDGTPQVPGDASSWWESVSRLPRTPENTILVPGSSLKGVFRSLLASAAANHGGAAMLPSPDFRDPRYAAQEIERSTLAPRAERGRVPNYDAGRLLLPHDGRLSEDVRARITPFGILTARQWRTFRTGTIQGAAALEAIAPGVTFESSLAIDEYLLNEPSGIFASFREILTPDLGPLLAAGAAFAQRILEQDRRFYSEVVGPPGTAANPRAATEELLTRASSLRSNQTMFQLGWGTGRAAKTPYRMHINDRIAGIGESRLNDVQRSLRTRLTPARSRRLSVAPDGKPGTPFGWLLCIVTPLAER